jgi:ammonia channel protein AmtB
MVGGIVGALLTGVFASVAINAAGANGSLGQVGKQTVAVGVTLVYSFLMTLGILKLADWLVGLRVSGEDEASGLDLSQHREVGYNWSERGGSVVQSPVREATDIAREAAVVHVPEPAETSGGSE